MSQRRGRQPYKGNFQVRVAGQQYSNSRNYDDDPRRITLLGKHPAQSPMDDIMYQSKARRMRDRYSLDEAAQSTSYGGRTLLGAAPYAQIAGKPRTSWSATQDYWDGQERPTRAAQSSGRHRLSDPGYVSSQRMSQEMRQITQAPRRASLLGQRTTSGSSREANFRNSLSVEALDEGFDYSTHVSHEGPPCDDGKPSSCMSLEAAPPSEPSTSESLEAPPRDDDKPTSIKRDSENLIYVDLTASPCKPNDTGSVSLDDRIPSTSGTCSLGRERIIQPSEKSDSAVTVYLDIEGPASRPYEIGAVACRQGRIYDAFVGWCAPERTKMMDFHFGSKYCHGLLTYWLRNRRWEDLRERFLRWLDKVKPDVFVGNDPIGSKLGDNEELLLGLGIVTLYRNCPLPNWIQRSHEEYHLRSAEAKRCSKKLNGVCCPYDQAHRPTIRSKKGTVATKTARLSHGSHCALYDAYELFLRDFPE